MKSGNLKFLEPSGPLQACNGTDLPFNQKHEILAFVCLFLGEMLVAVCVYFQTKYLNPFLSSMEGPLV